MKRMRNTTLLATALVSWASADLAAAQDAGTGALAITGVGVVDVVAGRVVPNQTVVIEGGRIVSLTTGGAPPATTRRIDGAGKYLIPGLWDMHVHMRSPSAPTLLMPQFIAHGVTGVRDMSSDCDGPAEGRVCIARLREWQERIAGGDLLGPRIVALSSFPLNPPWDFEVTEDAARQLVREIRARDADLIKVYYRLSPDAFGWIMDEAKKVGLDVAGHIPIRLTATAASNAGLRSLEHARDFLFDCFPGASEFRRTTQSQNPPMDVMRAMVDEHDVARCDEIFSAFVRNRTWYVPTHVTRRMDAFADDPAFRNDPRRRFIPPAVWDDWTADADRMVALDPSPEGRRVMRGFYRMGLEITGRAHAAGVAIALGTDAGDTYVFPGSSVHDELGELVKAGLTPAEALAAATIRAAEFMGRTADHGTVAVGKWADLVLLDANPLDDIAHVRSIDTVVLGGRVVSRVALDRLLEDVEDFVAALDSR